MAQSPPAAPKATRAQKLKYLRLLSLKWRRTLEGKLEVFVRKAWPILEPTTTLQWNWHLDLLCAHLEAVARGESRRVIINVPPRSMKSLLCTVFYPAWRWCTCPQRRFMFVSYSDELSTEHSILRRNVLSSKWYRSLWGRWVRFTRDQNEKTFYANTRGGTMFATSITGSATGKGCDELVVDDPINAKNAYSDAEREATNRNFDSTFRSRLNDPAGGTIVVIMQRLHDADLAGHLLTREPGTWTHLKLPAEAEAEESWKVPGTATTYLRQPGELLWKERFSHEVLADLKKAMGSHAYSGQYQQNPAPLEGTIIKKDWIRYYRNLPAAAINGGWLEGAEWIQSWDCSFKDTKESDYVVGQVWVKYAANYYLVDQVRERMDFVRTRQAIRAMSNRYPEATRKLVEDKANGPAVIASLRSEIEGIVPVDPQSSKAARLYAASPLFESSNVLLPESAPWIEDFVEELTRFPNAPNDDQVDACTQALQRLCRSLGGVYEFYREEAEKGK